MKHFLIFMQFKVIMLAVVLIFSMGSAIAQENTNIEEQQISPLTPSAASLGQYGSIPVSLYTGIPNIQIPLYQIKVNDFVLPISLSYHAGGIKVEDTPSWVGMGWTLNAGGMISRQMRGIVDERMIDKKDSYASYIDTLYDLESTPIEKDNAITALITAKYDTESDIFSINAGKLSQNFFLDTDGNPYCFPANKLLIEDEGRVNFNVNYIDSQIARWKITDKQGIQYIFGRSLDITDDESWDGIELYTTQANCNGWTPGSVSNSGDPQYISSWYLSEIILTTGESIHFSYEAFSFCVQQNLKGLYAVGDGGPYEEHSSGGVNYIQALRISEINFPSGKIEFIEGDDRKDMTGGKVLDRINIYSLISGAYELEKYYSFNTTNPEGNVITGDDEFRLALLSIQEFDKDGEGLPPHTFEYENQMSNNFGLPSRLSYAQDLWGYYNGQNGNSSLIPTYIMRDNLGGFKTYLESANRSVSTSHAKYGVLKKITYPTGGTSEFFYESNVARGATDPSDVNSQNPLIKLKNMEIVPFENQSSGLGLTNTNGTDEGYSTTFEIYKETGVNIDVSANILGGSEYCEPYEPQPGTGYLFDCFDLSFEEEVSPGVFNTINTTVYSERSYLFYPGKYRIKLKWTQGGNMIGEYAQVYLNWEDFQIPSNPVVDEYTEMTVGGLRIGKIVDTDPNTQKKTVRHFNYDFDFNDLQLHGTSGTIMNTPLNYYEVHPYPYLNASGIRQLIYNAHIITSYSSAPILQTNGGFVGYKKVTVDYGENFDGGRTSTYFLTAEDHIDGNISNSQKYPFPPSITYDWKRGLVEKEVYYTNSSGQYNPIRTVTNDYSFNESASDVNYKSLDQIKILRSPDPAYISGNMVIFNTISESFYQNESLSTDHTDIGDVNSTITYVQDDKSLEIASITTSNSDNDVVKKTYKYPLDYNNIENIETLKANNIIAVPIKIEATLNDIQSGGKITKYSDEGQPLEVYAYEKKVPSNVENHNANELVPTNYALKASYQYDDNSKLLNESRVADNFVKTYIWSYNKTQAVAKIENATFSEIENAVTNISSSFLNDLASSTSQIDIDSKLSQLRAEVNVDLPNAMITTYTYDPLIGVTSQTDPSGITTYYEYDGFGRLEYLKDEDGNVLKKYQYHYAGTE